MLSTSSAVNFFFYVVTFNPAIDYPWFREAKISDVLQVQLLNEDHLSGSTLDVDLHVESLEKPESFPLKYK